MGREGSSRGTTHISRARCLRLAGHFAPTTIGISDNVETTVQTSKNRSPEQLERELRLVSVECNFISCFAPRWRLPPVYFPLSLSFNWGRLLGFIIRENQIMSRLETAVLLVYTFPDFIKDLQCREVTNCPGRLHSDRVIEIVDAEIRKMLLVGLQSMIWKGLDR
jgi:hypothetical protein